MRRAIFLFCIIGFLFSGCKETPNGPVTNNYYFTDSLSNPNVQPRVVFTKPSNGAVGPFDLTDPYYDQTAPQITIQFNKYLNLSHGNPIIMKTDDTSYSLYPDNNYSTLPYILLFNIQHKYLANKIYTVTVDTTLQDIHGYRLREPYVFSFSPEPRFRVYSAYIPGNYVYSGQFSPVTIELNSKVDSTFFEKTQFSPPINGKWQYNFLSNPTVDSTIVYFVSQDTLLFDTTYNLTVTGDARDAKGLKLGAPYKFSFATPPFQASFSSYSSSTGPGGFTVVSNLQFYFNGLVDTSTIRPSVSITPTLSFDLAFYSYSGGYQYFYVNPNIQQEQRNTTYIITLNRTIRSSKGTYLKNPYSYSFTTGH